jgi:iron complex transport system substrate-binding protein
MMMKIIAKFCKRLKPVFAVVISAAMILSLFSLAGCGSTESSDNVDAPEISGLTFDEKMELKYADQFSVYKYKGGYSYIEIADSDSILVVPEGKDVPEELPENTVVIQQPLENIYLAATSAMSLFDAMDSLDAIKFSSVKADGWYIDNARKAMEDGEIVFAGKYNAPDFELLTSSGCQLALESTMILHAPEIKEKLEEVGIPVIIERASYESHPLGRSEWIKLYGVLLGREDEAEEAFETEENKVLALKDIESTGKTVVFFNINSKGTITIYKPDSYVAEMVKLAGGEYPIDPGTDNSESSMPTANMTIEDFYNQAKDYDIVVYNCNIASEIHTMEEFTALNELFADFKAVKDGNVWCTGKSMYQHTDKVGTIIEELHEIITGEAGDGSDLEIIYKLN